MLTILRSTFGNSEVYNIILITVVTMLYIIIQIKSQLFQVFFLSTFSDISISLECILSIYMYATNKIYIEVTQKGNLKLRFQLQKTEKYL